MNLEELKAENAAEEAAGAEEEVIEEVVEVTEVEVPEEVEPELDDEGNVNEEEVPLWMQEGDDQITPEQAPVGAVMREKKKRKELAGKLADSDDEVKRLRDENERLKQTSQAPQAATTRPVRPRAADFDSDDDYEAALDAHRRCGP